MNETDFIRKLASRARMETPPSVDVADRVMRAISGKPVETASPYAPLLWMTGVSVATAIFAGVLVFSHYQSVVQLVESLYFYPSLPLL